MGTATVVACSLLVYALVVRRLRTTPFTGPILFAVVGFVVGSEGFRIVRPVREGGVAEVLLEVTLVLVLFSDAMAISRSPWVRERSLPLRLLGIGLPLTILTGWGLALLVFPRLELWEAALLGTILAPTDAALGQAVVSDRRVPRLIRHGLGIESGLNDGLALPFLTIFLTLSLDALGPGNVRPVMELLRAIVASSAIGFGVAWVVARLLLWSSGRGWSEHHWRAIALLAVAGLAYVLADEAGGSGFIAAWVSGVTTGALLRDRLSEARRLPEELADVGTTLSFLVFGAIFLGPALRHVSWTDVVYALLSLTVIRMLPVALSVAGLGLARRSVLYVGWFGPRGLASLIFAGVIVESGLPGSGPIVDTVMLTVGLSVLLHGVTAWWGAERYANWYEAAVSTRPEIREAGPAEHLGERVRTVVDPSR